MLVRRTLACVVVALVLFVLWKRNGPPVSASVFRTNSGSGQILLQPGFLADGDRAAFYPGVPKPSTTNYSRTLVVPKVTGEDTRWIQEELPDHEIALYEVDNPSAKFHVPENKGHEAMVYLTYIIDSYDNLPDTVIFIHAHKVAWHNNFLLDLDTSKTIRRLRDDRVARHGYMNLRCHLDPGCPNWIHLDRAEVDYDEHLKPEERHFSFELFLEMFPGHRPPPVLSQPCCAQFAVSRDRIRDNPKAFYEHLRTWLLNTKLEDKDSGRIFEYMWQYIFTQNAEYCPAMNSCYCDGYGICFGSAAKLDAWLKKLKEKELADDEMTNAQKEKKEKKVLDEINTRLFNLNRELRDEKDEAFRRGEDEKNRAVERERAPTCSKQNCP